MGEEDDIDVFKWVDIEEVRQSLRREKLREEVVETWYRVLVDLQGILLVLYFLILTYLIPINVDLMGLPHAVVRSIILPILLALPWMIIYYGGLDKWAKTYKLVNVYLTRTSYFYKVFYVVNAVFIYLILVVPLLTPVLSMLSLIYFILILTRKFEKKKIKILVLLLTFSLYVLVFYYFLEQLFLIYFEFVLKVLLPFTLSFWVGNIYTIYLISLMIASMNALGSFIRFIYEGAKQFDETVEIPVKSIYAIEGLYLLAMLAVQFLVGLDLTTVYLGVLTLSVIEGILRRLKGLRKESELEGLGKFSKWIVYIIFLGIELTRRYVFFNPLLQIIPIGLGGFVFGVVFLFAYKKAGEIKWH